MCVAPSHHSTEKDRHFITPKCVCFQEFDYEIRRLECELENHPTESQAQIRTQKTWR